MITLTLFVVRSVKVLVFLQIYTVIFLIQLYQCSIIDREENLIIHKGKIVDKKKPTLKSEALPYRGHQDQTWASRLTTGQQEC